MSTCYKTSDNKYFGCPPKMSDGRHFTDYRPNCFLNGMVRDENKLTNSFQFRNFLQQNATELMDINRRHACQRNCCGPCDQPFQQSTMLPEKYKVICDQGSCRTVLNDVNGLGTGRVYSEEDVNCAKLPNAWPVDQNTNACVAPGDNFKYYPDNPNDANRVLRKAVPGGGNVLGGGDPTVYN